MIINRDLVDIRAKFNLFIGAYPNVNISFDKILLYIESNQFPSYADIICGLLSVLKGHEDYGKVRESAFSSLLENDIIDDQCDIIYNKLKQIYSETSLMMIINSDGTNFLLAAAKYQKIDMFVYLVQKVRYNLKYHNKNNYFWYSYDYEGKFIDEIYANDDMRQQIILNGQHDIVTEGLSKNVKHTNFVYKLKQTQLFQDLYNKYKPHILCSVKEFCKLYYNGIVFAHKHSIPFINETIVVTCILLAHDETNVDDINFAQTINILEMHTTNIVGEIVKNVTLCNLVHKNEKYGKIVRNYKSNNNLNLAEMACIYGIFSVVKKLVLKYDYPISYSLDLVSKIDPRMVIEMIRNKKVAEKLGKSLVEIVDFIKYDINVDNKIKEELCQYKYDDAIIIPETPNNQEEEYFV